MASADDPLRDLMSASQQTLEELSTDQPQLVVFLRHFGCTFCRETLADLSAKRDEIESAGFGIVLVHMVCDDEASDFFSSFGLGDAARISDPDCRLYRMFGLDKGGVRELFGLRVWLRGVIAGLLGGHGIGRIRGNPFQMPGVYVVEDGKLVVGFQHHQASDRPDYVDLIKRAVANRKSHEPSKQTVFA